MNQVKIWNVSPIALERLKDLTDKGKLKAGGPFTGSWEKRQSNSKSAFSVEKSIRH